MSASVATFSEIKEMVHRYLPQSHLITEKNMKRWYESALAGNQPIEWYLHRLKSIGGSEIGIIVAHALGVPADFGKTRESLYRSKLMLDPLDATTDAMAFGVKHEDTVRAMFEEMAFAAGWTRADAVLHKFKERSLSDSVVGGLGYSPDDAFIMEDGRLCMIDYKTPYRKVPSEANIPIGYISQLHQGAYIAKNELGLSKDHPLISKGVDRLLVCGIHPESKCRNRSKDLYLMSFDIAHNQQIEDIIVSAGKSFFSEYVLAAKSPTIVQSEIEAMAKYSAELLDLRRSLVEAEAELAAARVHAELIMKSAKDRIAQLGEDITKVSGDLSAIYLRSESRIDTDRALKDAGVVASAAITESLNIDMDDLRAYAEEMNMDLDAFIKVQSTGKIDTDKVVEAFKQIAPDQDMSEFEIKKESVDVKALIETGDLPDGFIGRSVTWKFSKSVLQPSPVIEDAPVQANQNDASIRM